MCRAPWIPVDLCCSSLRARWTLDGCNRLTDPSEALCTFVQRSATTRTHMHAGRAPGPSSSTFAALQHVGSGSSDNNATRLRSVRTPHQLLRASGCYYVIMGSGSRTTRARKEGIGTPHGSVGTRQRAKWARFCSRFDAFFSFPSFFRVTMQMQSMYVSRRR